MAATKTTKTTEKPADKASTNAVLPAVAIMRDSKDTSILLEAYLDMYEANKNAWLAMQTLVPQQPFQEIMWPFCVGWTVRHNEHVGPWIWNVQPRDTFQSGDNVVYLVAIEDDLAYVASDKATLLKFLDDTNTPRHAVIIRMNHAVR